VKWRFIPDCLLPNLLEIVAVKLACLVARKAIMAHDKTMSRDVIQAVSDVGQDLLLIVETIHQYHVKLG